MIQIQDLYKNFDIPHSVEVLKGISLEIVDAEIMCIIGASGAGKSTLLHLLGTLDRPSHGNILFDGEDIFRLNDHRLAEFRNRYIGFVFQFHHLLPEFTALENTAMPALIRGLPYQEASSRAKQILGDVGLADRLHHQPGELSGGEQQRVAIARALILEPRLILADEPTGNLDTHTGEEIFTLMKGLNKNRGMTLVMVTHNEKLSSQANRVVRMVDGKIDSIRPA